MTEADDKKKKKSSSSSKDKEGASEKKSSSKDKKSSKDKDDKKKSSSSSGKDKESSKAARPGSGGGSSKNAAAAAPQPRRPPPRGPPPPQAASNNDYLAGMDLPSSDSESDGEGRARAGGDRGEEARGALAQGAGLGGDKEAKKAADRERQALEKALRMKQEALREDANVFDVSYEGMGSDDAPAATATDVKVSNLTVRAKGKPLLENTALTIVAGRRYGLAGPNGRGKTTLLKLLARRQIPVPEGIDVLLVEQEVVGTDDQTALAAVVAADAELMELRTEEARLNDWLQRQGEEGEGGAGGEGKGGSGAAAAAAEQQQEADDEDDNKEDEDAANGAEAEESAANGGGSAQKAEKKMSKKKAARAAAAAAAQAAADAAATASGEKPYEMPADPAARLNEVYERMNELGASTAEARASKILHGLGFTEAMQKRVTSSFSGGWRMRISLARALYVQPTLLLLDEPTNHLDLRAVLWLEEYLQRWKKTLVVVSHDRDFLNSITTDVIHLHDNQLHFYRGNFAQFEEMYEQKRREVNKAFDKYEKQLKAAKQSGKSSKQAADKVAGKGGKGGKGGSGGGGGGGGGMAESSRDGGPNAAPQRWSDYTVSFSFPEPTELPPPLMQLVDAGFRYPGRDDFGLSGLNIGVDMGSRVAIVGPNGAGKTTLMNLLSGDLTPNEGESRRSHKLRIGRYAQHFVDALEMDVNPVEYLLHKYPESGLRPEQMRAMLGRFGLSGHHHLTPIVKLSGGQKARVVFASIALSKPHILLLDEVRFG
jgi:ATP-binding cassette subfamily F protein 1